MKKGAGVAEAITRIPMVWFGKGVKQQGLSDAHVSLIDIFPTACEIMGSGIPLGVQGRSLTQVLSGEEYPKTEFQSIISEAGFGGQFITAEDADDYHAEGAIGKGLFFDELNSWSQSGTISMVRKGDWKFVMDMNGNCELYNLKKDPSEVNNPFVNKEYQIDWLKQDIIVVRAAKFEKVNFVEGEYKITFSNDKIKDYCYYAVVVQAPSGCAKPKGFTCVNFNPEIEEQERVFIP